MHSTLFGGMTALRGLLAGFMTLMGVLHFTHGPVFAAVVPDYLPQPLLLVYLSGICELALGVGLLFERTRVPAAWGLMALFVAVFPANVHMALHPDLPISGVPPDLRPSSLALWLRLPLQLLFLYWAYRYTRPAPALREQAL